MYNMVIYVYVFTKVVLLVFKIFLVCLCNLHLLHVCVLKVELHPGFWPFSFELKKKTIF